MTLEVLEEKIKRLEQRQQEFVLREIHDLFVDDFRDLKEIVHRSRTTQLKMIGALVAFKIIYAPLVVLLLELWIAK